MKKWYLRISNETAGQYRVGISPADFFDNFMPWNEKTSDCYKNARPPVSSIEKLKQMDGKAEKDMYGLYHEALNPWIEGRTECDSKQSAHVIKTLLRLGRFRDNYTGSAKVAVDIGHYDASEMPIGRMDFSLMQTQVEFGAEANWDPFVDPQLNGDSDSLSGAKSDNGIEPKANVESGRLSSNKRYPWKKVSKEAIEMKGKIAACAAITLHLSYRTHLFTVGVFGEYCRFIRWDRRGAVVTRRMNYTKEPELIFDFYHRFAQLTRHERGFDPTVTRIDPTSDEASLARGHFDKYSEAVLHGQAKADKPAELPFPVNPSLLKMTVVFDGVERSFIMPSPPFHFGCLSPFSRSTRRCLVYDIAAAANGTQEVLFMKDCWREASDRTSPEATVYRLLKEKGVTEYVAEMDIGGDIPGLRTRSQEPRFGNFSFFSDQRMKAQKPLQVHRIFLKTIAQDLTIFTNARWLVGYVADAMEAAINALNKAGVLHRDISVGNIMIARDLNPQGDGTQVAQGRGILIDWDLCIILSESMPPPRKTLTGTWQFISARILQGNHKSHSYLDDQESAYWVLLYMALCFLKNNLSPDELLSDLQNFFNQRFREPHKPDTGGRYKLAHIKSVHRFDDLCFEVPGLAEMFQELADTLLVTYSKPPSSDDFRFLETVDWRKLDQAGRRRLTNVEAYTTATPKLQNSRWFIETLREHALRIPTSREDSCDYHYNNLPNDSYISSDSDLEGYDSESSQLSTTRTHSLTGEPMPPVASTISKRGLDDTQAPQAKKRKLTLGEN